MALTWDNNYELQQPFIQSIRQRAEYLEDRLLPTTVHQQAEPTAAQLAAGWTARKDSDMTIPVFARTQWFDPAGTVQQEYRKIQDLTGPVRSSDTLYGVTPRIASGTFPVCLGTQYIDDTAAAGPLLFPDIPQTYKDLLVYIQIRDVTAAVVQNVFIRPNNSSVAQYAQNYISGNNAFSATYGTEAVSQSAWFVLMPGNTSERIQFGTFLVRIHRYASTDNFKKMWLYGTNFWGATVAAATKTNYQMHGVWNNAAPITSLAIGSNGGANLQMGTKAVLWAL